ncbi:MAG: molybdenum cofactor biosynthesis protein MoaE [Pseudomonadota bacterium]
MMEGDSVEDGVFSVSVQDADFDITAETRLLTGGNTGVGAVVSFMGIVRGSSDSIRQMDLEHYPGMTERSLNAILFEARDRWSLEGARVVHRVGTLLPGDQIVLVLTASRNRQSAFEAAEFIMDYLKTRAAFWKREHTAAGARWVDARETDNTAADRWRT